MQIYCFCFHYSPIRSEPTPPLVALAVSSAYSTHNNQHIYFDSLLKLLLFTSKVRQTNFLRWFANFSFSHRLQLVLPAFSHRQPVLPLTPLSDPYRVCSTDLLCSWHVSLTHKNDSNKQCSVVLVSNRKKRSRSL